MSIDAIAPDQERTPSRAACLTLIGLILVLSPVACTKGPTEPPNPSHVVFISIDTARADHFGFMGNPDVRTPNLDALADESVVFTDYMTVVPTTLASHVTLFSGKYPHSHGTPRNGFMVNRKNRMLPEILKQAGYHTAGFAGSFALDSRFDFDQGFDHYDEDFGILVGESGAYQNQRLAASVTDAVIAYLDTTDIPEKLFLFVHYFDPHRPYSPPAPFDTIYDPRGRADLIPIEGLRQRSDQTSKSFMRNVRGHRLQYAAEITYTDHHIGLLLDSLRKRGILDNAILVVTSDHGESLWEHGEEFDHGLTVHQAVAHSICMIRLPGGDSGGTSTDRPVASIDVMPTVLGLLGLPAPSEVDGETVNLETLAEPAGPRLRFCQATKPLEEVEKDPRWTNMQKSRCIRSGPYKLIRTPYRGTAELYDVVSDPNETINLLEDPGPDITALAESLKHDLQSWAASADPLSSRFEPSQMEETVRRLKSIGYLR